MSRRRISSRIFVALFVLVWVGFVPVKADAWGNPELLVKINDTSYTRQDFFDWWEVWKEPETPLPQSPDAFIDWMLQVQEAENMQLFDSPRYRKKVSVFLRARALMLLKQEDVDSKIPVPSDDDLWSEYEKTHLPQFNLKLVSVTTDQERQQVAALLEDGVSLDAAAEAAGLFDRSAYMAETGLMGPGKIPEPLLEVVRPLQPGERGGPVAFEDYSYFVEVLARDDGNQKDFEALRGSLEKQWYKQQVNRLTADLLDRLRSKYQVEVNDTVVAQIGLEPLDAGLAEQVAVKMGNLQVLAQAIQETLAKDFKLRHRHYGTQDQEELLAGLRQRVIADMLSQTLTGMEALDRHYEEKEPFRKTYRFYCQNRLIKELEGEVIAPQLQLTDADIAAAYQADIGRYTRTGLVEVIMVGTKEEGLARLVADDLQRGEDFAAAMAPIAPLGVVPQTLPFDHLQPELQPVVAGLTSGQVASMVPSGEEFYFIKLLKQDEQQVMPLEMVRAQVRSRLAEERFQQARDHLLQQLRERSAISVKHKVWKKIVAQLEKDAS